MANLDGDPELEVDGGESEAAAAAADSQPEPDEDEGVSNGEDVVDGENGDEDGESDAELDAIEFGGKTYKVPKELKEGFLLKSDYTNKTKDLSEQRRAFEAERTQAIQHDAEALQRRGQLALAESQVRQLKATDWNALRLYDQENGTDAVGQARQALSDWKDYLSDVKEQVEADDKKSRESQSSAAIKRVEAAREALSRDIPDWTKPDSEGKTLALKVAEHAIANYGFSLEELQTMADPRVGKLMHRAYQRDKLAAKQKQNGRQNAEPPPTPARTVGRGGGTANSRAPSDRDSVESWIKKRNAQLSAR